MQDDDSRATMPIEDGPTSPAQHRALAVARLGAGIEAYRAGDRTTALREAAQAVALDPTLREAGELIARIVIEPPATMPADIAAAVAQDNLTIQRRTARFVAMANFGFLAFVPLLLVAGKRHPVTVGAMCVLVAGNALLLAWTMRRSSAAVRWWRLLVNVLLTVLVSRIASPFLLGPGLAAVTAVGLVVGTFHTNREAIVVGIALSLGVIGPWLAEIAGWLPSTMTVVNGQIVLDSALLTSAGTVYAGLALFTIVIVTAACMLTRGVRIAESAARMQLHLETWQLRRLR